MSKVGLPQGLAGSTPGLAPGAGQPAVRQRHKTLQEHPATGRSPGTSQHDGTPALIPAALPCRPAAQSAPCCQLRQTYRQLVIQDACAQSHPFCAAPAGCITYCVCERTISHLHFGCWAGKQPAQPPARGSVLHLPCSAIPTLAPLHLQPNQQFLQPNQQFSFSGSRVVSKLCWGSPTHVGGVTVLIVFSCVVQHTLEVSSFPMANLCHQK